MSIAANNGLGEEALPVSRARGDTVLKCIYVAETFFVLSVCITKLSVATLLSLLFTQLQHRRLINAFSSGILLFAFPSLFVVLFQCHVPRVWALFSNGNSCVDMVSFRAINHRETWLVFRYLQSNSNRCRLGGILALLRCCQYHQRAFSSIPPDSHDLPSSDTREEENHCGELLRRSLMVSALQPAWIL